MLYIMGIFNHELTNLPDKLKSQNKYFFITAFYKKSKETTRLLLNEITSYQIIPYQITLYEISCYFFESVSIDYNLTLVIKALGSKTVNKKINSTKNERRQNFPVNIEFEKNDILWFEVYKKDTNTPIEHNNVVFSITFQI